MKEAPVIVLAHLNEAQRRALVIADNQLAMNAGWDEELLRVELAILHEGDYDLDLLGFDDVLAHLLAGAKPILMVCDPRSTRSRRNGGLWLYEAKSLPTSRKTGEDQRGRNCRAAGRGFEREPGAGGAKSQTKIAALSDL
jgi:hypothetical protein